MENNSYEFSEENYKSFLELKYKWEEFAEMQIEKWVKETKQFCPRIDSIKLGEEHVVYTDYGNDYYYEIEILFNLEEKLKNFFKDKERELKNREIQEKKRKLETFLKLKEELGLE